MLVVAGIGWLAVSMWYPGPYFHASGGAGLVQLLVLVDVVLGPALTLLVFDRRKRSLRFDMATIIAVQLAAMGYGLYAAAQGRPVFQVFAVDRFELVAAAESDPTELAQAPESMRKLSWGGPRLVAASLPADAQAKQVVLFSSVTGGADLRNMARYYRPYEQVALDALARARPLAELDKYNRAADVHRALATVGHRPEALRFLPIQGRHADLVALLDATSGMLVAIVDLKPWL